MSVQFSKTDVIEKNRAAITAAQTVINRLQHLVGLPGALEARRLAELNRANNLITQLRAVNAHLTAANTVVRPMSDDTAAELNSLANRLDQQIASDAITNATLDFIKSVLDDANRLRTIINSN